MTDTIEIVLQLMALAVAAASGVFGWSGVAFVAIVLIAATFLVTMLIVGVERLAALLGGLLVEAVLRMRGLA